MIIPSLPRACARGSFSVVPPHSKKNPSACGGDEGDVELGGGGGHGLKIKGCFLEAQRAAFTLAQASGLGGQSCGLRPEGPRYFFAVH